jgi:methanogenic corrinoid protein MtbC1
VEESNAEVIGLSIAMPYYQSQMKDTIRTIRKAGAGKDVKILIGGNAFNSIDAGTGFFDADGFAPDAKSAVELAQKLVNK